MSSTATIHPFIQALQAKQRELKISDADMAQRLGVSASYYWRLTNGKRGVTLALAQRSVKAFPELTVKALSFFQPE